MLIRTDNKSLLRLLGLMLLLGMWCWEAHADMAVLDVSQAQAQSVSLASHLAVLEDPSRDLSLDDVRRLEMEERFKQDAQRKTDLNFGQTKSAIWLRLRLKNSGDQAVERLLELPYSGYLDLQFFAPTSATDGDYTVVTTGRVLPFDSRAYPNRFFVFPISLPPHTEQTLYLRAHSFTLPMSAKLWEATAFHRYERNDYTTQAIYFGVAAAMFLFNLFLLVALRDRMYLWYLAALICITLSMAEQSGLAKEFLWPNSPYWSLVAINVGFMLSILTLATFMRRMLDTAVTMPRLDRFFQLLSGILLCSVVGLLLNTEKIVPVITWLGLIGLSSILACGVYGIVLRLRSAYFFVAAYSVVLVSSVAYAMRNLSLVSTHPMMSQAMQIGSALEMIVLALALADRFFQLRLENVRVHKSALDAQTQLVDMLKSSERELEQRVTERTQELADANRQLDDIANTDALTQLPNRRHAMRSLNMAWLEAVSNDSALACMMIDADGFKQINDTQGHDAGDRVLRALARQLRNALPTDYLVCRLGGDEFFIICADTPMKTVLQLAERIRAEVASLRVAAGTGEWRGSISVGVAVRTAGMVNMEDMLKVADLGLYAAKRNGRNCVAVADADAIPVELGDGFVASRWL